MGPLMHRFFSVNICTVSDLWLGSVDEGGGGGGGGPDDHMHCSMPFYRGVLSSHAF